MLILEIAAAIVLAVLVLVYWRAVFALGGLALAATIAGVVVILAFSTDWRISWQDIAAVVVIAGMVAAALRLHKHRHPAANG